MRIGPYHVPGSLALAPMAGVTDRPFRLLCRRLGAGMAASEMVASNPALRATRKSRLRGDHQGEPSPRIVQIAGAEPAMMADAARYNVQRGAQIIDINMGCPAKKVCHRFAGSALLADEGLVADILAAVVDAVPVPVTLKIRTGVSPERRNAMRVARLAERLGIAALAVHGRTRADAYRGCAEHDTLREIREVVDLPLLANGDIDSPQRAREVLDHTRADGLMIGRAAQGNPWIFRAIAAYLDTGQAPPPPDAGEVRAVMVDHIRALHRFYGETHGLRVARKHIGWYLAGRPDGEAFRARLVRLEDPQAQIRMVNRYFDQHGGVAA